MSNSSRNIWFWVRAWLPVLVGVVVIVLESTEMMGSDNTSAPLRRLFEAIFGVIKDDRWEIVHLYIRKCSHFIGYGLIGLAWLRAWWMTLPRSYFFTDALLALAGTSVVATLDEYHQTFLPNRTSSPYDVLLDCCGAITLQLLMYVFMRIAKPKRWTREAYSD